VALRRQRQMCIRDSLHIFEKFYRIGSEETRKQAGSGLGLYIVAEYVRLHNGQIRCIENNPSGSIFELILPI
jgi:two-component system phosphate regulon sensor histidine kinase PhoR